MDSGITIYNDSNTVQIDNKYRNLSLARTRTLSAGDQIIMPPSSNPRMSAIYSEGGVICAPIYLNVSGYFVSDNAYSVVGNGTFYDFEDLPLVAGDYGLNVFKDDGSLCFSSAMQPLRVLYAGSGTLGSYLDATLYSGTIAAGRKIAVILGQQPICVYADGSKIHSKALKVTTSATGFVSVVFTTFELYTANVTGSQGNLNYNFLIVDITGF
jgi:hypothetical protein